MDRTVSTSHSDQGLRTLLWKGSPCWIPRFILDPMLLPTNAWGSTNISRLDTEDGLREELQQHLQTIGKYVKAEDFVEYLDRQDTNTCHGATVSISIITGRRWMAKLDYLWTDTPSGQYVDGPSAWTLSSIDRIYSSQLCLRRSICFAFGQRRTRTNRPPLSTGA
jgi:hypothetical protein